MPHKKAKRSLREQDRKEKGIDLAPAKNSLRNEAIPKSAARVFNAQSVRDEFKKKRKFEDEHGEQHGKRQKVSSGKTQLAKAGKVSLSIQPGESMQHFNRRVEDDLRPLVKSAVQASRAVERSVAKEEREARAEGKKGSKRSKEEPKPDQKEPKPTTASSKRPSSPTPEKHAGRPKEFAVASSAAPKRLNDIAQAPPELKKLPRGASSAPGKKEGVLSMSQKLMMEQEREKAIARYRELKASRKQTSEQEA